MLLKIFALYDSKAEAYNKPFYQQTTGAALRDFEEACKQPDSMIAKYPADFTLFEIGVFNDEDCEIIMHNAKINLGNALEYSTQKPLEAVGE